MTLRAAARRAYDYDGWKESTEAAAMSSREKAKAELAAEEAKRRAPRYIGALKAKAVEREVRGRRGGCGV